MRTIHEHQVNPANDRLQIEVIDEPGSGGASHLYRIRGFAFPDASGDQRLYGSRVDLPFQNGPIAEVGVNGVTHEALLAIVADRLRSFQAGPYACRENALALTKIEEAMHWLHHRTPARVRRGVEGTHEV